MKELTIGKTYTFNYETTSSKPTKPKEYKNPVSASLHPQFVDELRAYYYEDKAKEIADNFNSFGEKIKPYFELIKQKEEMAEKREGKRKSPEEKLFEEKIDLMKKELFPAKEKTEQTEKDKAKFLFFRNFTPENMQDGTHYNALYVGASWTNGGKVVHHFILLNPIPMEAETFESLKGYLKLYER